MNSLINFIYNNIATIYLIVVAIIIVYILIFLIKYIKLDKGKHYEIIKKNERLQKIKKKAIKWLISLIIFIILILFQIICFFYNVLVIPVNPNILIILFIMVLISIIMIIKHTKNYSLIYKNEIIHRMIEDYDPNIIYNQHLGINEHDYLDGKFEYYDKYYSEDLITRKTMQYSYNLSDVKTTIDHIDSDGTSHYSVIFEGTVAIVDLPKSINSNILILNNQIKFRTPISYVAIDNAEFESKFDVHTDDKIMAMRILTPFITDKIMKFNEKTKIKMEFKIFNNKAYFRFYTKNLFEPSMFFTKFENKNIDEYMAILKYIDELMILIIKEINNLEV